MNAFVFLISFDTLSQALNVEGDKEVKNIFILVQMALLLSKLRKF